MSRRVVVTGIGLVTALGVGVEDNWSELKAGHSGVAPIASYDASSLRSQLGAEVTALKPRDFVDRRALRNMTRYDMLATVAGVLAMQDSGLELGEDTEGRHGLFTASGKEISEPEHFQDVAVAVRDDDGQVDLRRFGELAFEQVHPLFYIEGLQGASLFYLSDAFPLRGANTFFAGGPEAGLTAVGRAFRAIRRGEADVVLAGAADAPVCWWNMAKVDSLGLTTPHNELGDEACRPYDRDRDGTVMGEGEHSSSSRSTTRRAPGGRAYMPRSPALARPPTSNTWWRPIRKAARWPTRSAVPFARRASSPSRSITSPATAPDRRATPARVERCAQCSERTLRRHTLRALRRPRATSAPRRDPQTRRWPRWRSRGRRCRRP